MFPILADHGPGICVKDRSILKLKLIPNCLATMGEHIGDLLRKLFRIPGKALDPRDLRLIVIAFGDMAGDFQEVLGLLVLKDFLALIHYDDPIEGRTYLGLKERGLLLQLLFRPLLFGDVDNGP